MANELDTAGLNLPELNRAGRRAAEKRAKRKRAAGAALAAGAATFSTTAALLGVGVTAAGAANQTVTSLLDNGDGTCDATCTLRDAVGDVGAGETITFDPSLSGTITLTAGEIAIDKSLAINGPGVTVISVNGNDNDRIFNIDGGGGTIDVFISGLELTNGNAFEGGAINIGDVANVTIRDTVINNNHADSGGGGVNAVHQDIDLLIENSTISGNDTDGWGGGIYFYSAGGSLTLTNATISGNSANSGGGGLWAGGEETVVTVTSTFVAGNTAGSYGGGLAIDDPSVSITGSSVTGNTAGEDGGGLYFHYNNSLTIDSTIISNNTADGGGGGIWTYDVEGATVISNSTISGNTASNAGGGLYVYGTDDAFSIINTEISGNTAEAGGGAFFYDFDNPDQSTNIVGSVISGNHATDGFGGGLYMGYMPSTTTIAFTTIAGNDATASGGGVQMWTSAGALRILNSTLSGNTSGGQGGGLYIGFYNSSQTEIFNSTISGNTAEGEGGGVALAGSYYGLEIAQSTITGNVGATVGGLAIYCFSVDAAKAAAARHSAGTKVKETRAAATGDDHHGRTGTKEGKGAKERGVHARAYGDVSASGTIISGNSGTDVGECGHVTSDHSLIGTIVGTTLTDVGGTILGKLALVAPLANNGGPTQTHALLPDSPAINAGPVPVADFEGNQNDQRGEGFPRVVAGVVDIGAFEVQPPPVNFTG